MTCLILVAFIGAVYLVVVVGVGKLFGSAGRLDVILSVSATAVVAVAFQSVRQRAQRLVDRVVHGQRATPYEVLSQFSEQMAGTTPARTMLPQIAKILVERAGAARVEVWLRTGQRFVRAGGWPECGYGTCALEVFDDGELPRAGDPTWTSVAVRYRSETLGALAVATTSRRPLSAMQYRLLTDFAVQVGLVMRNILLVEDICESRRRLVAAQDAERRLLESDIHDRVERPLSALATTLSSLRPLADTDEVRRTLDLLESEAGAALSELRDLARGVYPALLSDFGPVGALQAQAGRSPVVVAFEAEPLRRHAHATEAAVYFCCLEALQNIAKHAQAQQAVVRLWDGENRLHFSVRDDGVGIESIDTALGSGLRNMTDRIEALGGGLQIHSSPGGGTTVVGWLPAPPVP